MKLSIEEIADIYSANLFYNDIRDRAGTYISKREIQIGAYSDIELRDVSFFHELGHIEDDLSKCRDRFDQEVRAWVLGFQLAEKYGYSFSKDTRRQCANWLKSYLNDNALFKPVHRS